MTDAGNLKLVPVDTYGELAKRCIEQNGVHWRGSLSTEEYVERDFALRRRIEANGLGHLGYALVTESGEIVAACEALERPAVFRNAHSANLEHTTDYNIASVFTPEKHRRKGYAQIMIDRVVEAISVRYKSTVQNSQCAISLWSDVGEFYARSGFELADVPGAIESLTWTPKEAKWPTGVDELSREQALAVSSEHRQLILNSFNAACDNDPSRPRFAVVPNKGLYEHLLQRSEYSAKTIGASIKVFGARTRNLHGWAVWMYNYETDKKLTIVAIYGSTNEIAELLEAAGAAAHTSAGVLTVELYITTLVNVDLAELIAGLESRKIEGASVGRRKGSWPMSIGPVNHTQWAFPGKYAWY